MYDAQLIRKQIIAWVREWFDKNGPDSPAVIGISGGKDSTVAAAVLVEALGKERVIGVLMPDDVQPDIADSYRVVQALGIRYIEVNVGSATCDVCKSILTACQNGATNMEFFALSRQALTNIAPRIRMTTLYAVSQCHNGRVVNTSNRSEIAIGWSTRWGDGVGDVALFSSLTASEVVALGDTYEELPYDLVHKAPADGLGVETDEEHFGFTYKQLDAYLENEKNVDEELRATLKERVKRNMFKRLPIPQFHVDTTPPDTSFF